MSKLKKSFNRETARRTVNWLQDIFHLDIVCSRNHSAKECVEDIKIIINHMINLKTNENKNQLDKFIKENQSLNRRIGTLENKLKLSEENSQKYCLGLEKKITEIENYENTIKNLKELYQEEHEKVVKLTAKKWWQIWK